MVSLFSTGFCLVWSSFWSDLTYRRLSTAGNDSGAFSTANGDINVLTHHASSTPLLREWVKATLTPDTWKDVLDSAVRESIVFCYHTHLGTNAADMQFILPRITIYQTVCECLKVNNLIADVVECFHQMTSELGDVNESSPMMEWVFGEIICYLLPVMHSIFSIRFHAALPLHFRK